MIHLRLSRTIKLVTASAAGVVLVGCLTDAVVPAHAEPELGAQAGLDEAGDGPGAAFLESLRAAGISYSSPNQAVAAARTVCALVDRGEPGLQVIADLKTNNPGFTTDGAAQFAAIAANIYCPHQL